MLQPEDRQDESGQTAPVRVRLSRASSRAATKPAARVKACSEMVSTVSSARCQCGREPVAGSRPAMQMARYPVRRNVPTSSSTSISAAHGKLRPSGGHALSQRQQPWIWPVVIDNALPRQEDNLAAANTFQADERCLVQLRPVQAQ